MSDSRAYRISGRVQGVGFRWWAREAASRLRLRGTVRNEAGGTVWLEASGSPESLDRLEELLRQGPPGGRVDRVQPEPPSGRPLPRGFEITS
jgi:acylphosphatase